MAPPLRCRVARAAHRTILLQRVADERAEQRGRVGRARVVVRILVVAAAPGVAEPVDQHVPRDEAPADAPFARGDGARVRRVAASASRSGGGSSSPASASAAGWPLSARYWRTSCAALTGATTSSSLPWTTTSGTGSAPGVGRAARVARDRRDSRCRRRASARRARQAADDAAPQATPECTNTPATRSGRRTPSAAASAPPDDIPATNTRLRVDPVLAAHRADLRGDDRRLAPAARGRGIEPVPAAPGVGAADSAAAAARAQPSSSASAAIARGRGDLLGRLPAAVDQHEQRRRGASARGRAGRRRGIRAAAGSTAPSRASRATRAWYRRRSARAPAACAGRGRKRSP